MKAARRMVLHSGRPIGDIASEIGYGSVVSGCRTDRKPHRFVPTEAGARVDRDRVEGNGAVPS